MQNGQMTAWIESSHLAGANASYIEDLYESFLQNPSSVSEEWQLRFHALNAGTSEQIHTPVRDYFRRLAMAGHSRQSMVEVKTDIRQIRVLQLINAYRSCATRSPIWILLACGNANP